MSERLPYDAYVHFASPERNPWGAECINNYLRYLATSPEAAGSVTDEEAEAILLCYDQSPSHRVYHGPNHGGFMGQPDIPEVLAALLSDRCSVEEAKATLAVAGLFHDAAYKHVDTLDLAGNRAWPTALRDLISGMAEYSVTVDGGKPLFTTRLTDEGRHDAVTMMVAQIFDMDEKGIVHNQGGNEFDSALAAAKFLENKNVSPKHIIAVTSAIAATVPFGLAMETDKHGTVSDGHMSKLAHKVKSARLADGKAVYQPDWQDTNDIMLLSVHLANRDISPFIQPDSFADVVRGGRGIKREESPVLRTAGEMTARRLARAATVQSSAPFLYQGLGGNKEPVSAEQVPHLYIPRDSEGTPRGIGNAYPPQEIYNEAVAHVERNARMASEFFQAHEASITFVTSIATLIGEPDAPVPGIVDANRWSATTHPRGEVFARLSRDEKRIYDELMYGFSQTDMDITTPHRSPLGGMIYGALGSEGIVRVSDYIQEVRAEARKTGSLDPFCDPYIARRYFETIRAAIGPDNFDSIRRELLRAARYYVDDSQRGSPDREARLNRLMREG